MIGSNSPGRPFSLPRHMAPAEWRKPGMPGIGMNKFNAWQNSANQRSTTLVTNTVTNPDPCHGTGLRADLQGSCDVIYTSWIRETAPLFVGCAPFVADTRLVKSQCTCSSGFSTKYGACPKNETCACSGRLTHHCTVAGGVGYEKILNWPPWKEPLQRRSCLTTP